ncbi:MAG: hypothetical protein KOO60_12470 [Gemmatimonadales bacterium]|nr:hypothetical protein [Gemmatimonadales bacterium]
MSVLDVLKSPASRVLAPMDCTPEIIDLPAPDRVLIPLEYPGKILFRPLVQVGDEVVCNQVIGRSDRNNFIHASISGKVVEMRTMWAARSFHVPAVVIEKSDAPPLSGDELLRQCDIDPRSPTRLDLLRAAGVISPWTTPGRDDSEADLGDYPDIEQIVIKGMNQEPTICSFRLLLRTRSGEVQQALRRLSEIAPQARILLAVCKADAQWAGDTFSGLADVAPLSNNFRDRIERKYVRRLTGVKVPNKASYRSGGIAVISVEQLLDMYDALEGLPCIRKTITISSGKEFTPVTVRTALGTSIGDLLASQGLVVEDGDRVIMGGPMAGTAQFTLETPLSKFQAGIHVLKAKDIIADVNLICVNCGRCTQACSSNLQVHLIGRCVEFDQLAEATTYYPGACIECGLCAFVCPAHRPLVQMVKMAANYRG